jgi:hypothetical protein
MKYQHLLPRSNCMGYTEFQGGRKHCVEVRQSNSFLSIWNLRRATLRWGPFMSLKSTLQAASDWVHYFKTI